MQFQADVLGVPVVVPEIAETTALGAAYLAGVGDRAPGRPTTSRALWREAARYEPRMSEDERAALLGRLAAGGRALAGLGALTVAVTRRVEAGVANRHR